MSNMDMSLVPFEPGALIEISDIMHGFRKLGVVAEGGQMYFDLADADATPCLIYKACQPEAVGNSHSWGLELGEADPAAHKAYSALQQRLLDEGVDTLTLTRALYWAYQNRVFEYGRALAAGKAATEEVRKSRATMDRILSKTANG